MPLSPCVVRVGAAPGTDRRPAIENVVDGYDLAGDRLGVSRGDRTTSWHNLSGLPERASEPFSGGGLCEGPAALRSPSCAVVESAPFIPLSRYVVNYKMRPMVAESYQRAKSFRSLRKPVQKIFGRRQNCVCPRPTRPTRRPRRAAKQAIGSIAYSARVARNFIAQIDSLRRGKNPFARRGAKCRDLSTAGIREFFSRPIV
jgi:hypothetical protein